MPQSAYTCPYYDEVAANAAFAGTYLPIVAGSDIRMIEALTAAAGPPTTHDNILEGLTEGGDWVILGTISLLAVGSASILVENCPRQVRVRRTLVGAGATVTYSLDLIIRPPEVQ